MLTDDEATVNGDRAGWASWPHQNELNQHVRTSAITTGVGVVAMQHGAPPVSQASVAALCDHV